MVKRQRLLDLLLILTESKQMFRRALVYVRRYWNEIWQNKIWITHETSISQILLLPDNIGTSACVFSTLCRSGQTMRRVLNASERASSFSLFLFKMSKDLVSGISVNWYVIFAYLFDNINYTVLQFLAWNRSFFFSLFLLRDVKSFNSHLCPVRLLKNYICI